MTSQPPFLIGCNGRGVQPSSITHPVGLAELPTREQFRLVKEAEVFDYFDRLPLRSNLHEYTQAMAEFDLPVHTASWFYRLGDAAEHALLLDNLKICREVGAQVHNIMTFTHHADGHKLTDDEVVDHYLQVYDAGMALGVAPSFELHVNMWTEDFLQVERVARAVQARGITFHFTLDYSHVNFKIGNPKELELSGVRKAVARGEVVLDPFEPGNLCQRWLDMGMVCWTQLRTVAPKQPGNLWHRLDEAATDPSLPFPATVPSEGAQYARGIQYPITKPAPGEWHSPWNAYQLEPSKEAIRLALRYHITHPGSPLRFITTEMINLPDYGLGAGYNLLQQNIEAARFVRRAWDETVALHAAGLL
ncbi:MAG: xylose isomerase [Hydrogenophaga sp.]|nr:xylose isomerase [Hydrogenophaga sp.]